MKLETDRLQNEIYPVHGAFVPEHKAIEVDLEVLEHLAARYNTPHFVISGYNRIDSDGIHHDARGIKLHFTHLPVSGLVIAYEKMPEKQEGIEESGEIAFRRGDGKVVIV